MTRHLLHAAAAVCLLGAGCSTATESSETSVDPTDGATNADTTAATAAADTIATVDTTTDTTAIVDDVDCSEEALSGGDAEFVFTSAYVIDDGRLGPRCFGDDDATVLDAWVWLSTIAPPEQLSDLRLFGGFEPDGDEAADTMAFVNAIDVDGESFQMSINTVEAIADPDELLLTLAHEFSHVFTATPLQLDRTDEAVETCETYFNGEGCYLDDALLFDWIREFWAPEVLAGVDPFEESADGADARCAEDDGFFGPYAATTPEEDFAEAFSAFVFDLEATSPGQADRLTWLGEQPGLVEFRDRARDAGLTPLANRFELCGY